jgi:hypothetical protein
VVTGFVKMPEGYAGGRAYVGVFDTPIMQRRPPSAAVINIGSPDQAAPYRLTCVPEGTWYLHAVAVTDTVDPEPWSRRTLLVTGPVVVRVAGDLTVRADVCLRSRRLNDLPVLLALPDLEAPMDDLEPITESAVVADLASPPRS